MVTSSVRMLDGILRNSTNLGPAVALDGIFVVGISGLQQRLIGTATTGDDTNLRSDRRGHGFLSTRRQTHTSGSLLFIVRDDNRKGSRAASKGTTVSLLGLNVANNGSLGNNIQGQDIAYSQGSLLSAIDKLTSVHAFCADKEFVISLETVGIQKLNLGNGSTTTRVMKNLLDDSTNVTSLFGIVDRTELDGTLTGTDMRSVNGGLTLTLCLQ
jgi:hypothetical protein